MRFEELKIADVIPYENNPRKNDGAVEAVMESIRQCSYISPIIIDENRVILAGHTRYKALVKLGFESVQCLICDGLTEEQKKKFRYLDNKTGEKAVWDLVKLEKEIADLDFGAFDFFGLATDLSGEIKDTKEAEGATEFSAESFDDEKFKYQCPECGFRFN